jgi:hypothetical protein
MPVFRQASAVAGTPSGEVRRHPNLINPVGRRRNREPSLSSGRGWFVGQPEPIDTCGVRAEYLVPQQSHIAPAIGIAGTVSAAG